MENFGCERLKIIGVIGSSIVTADEYQLARTVGTLIVKAGHCILSGGLSGAMEAASRGAAEFLPKEQHSRIIGILPGENKKKANRWVGLVLTTGIGKARNAIIAQAADGLIAVAGASGTLSEIALGWQFGKPIAIIKGISSLLDPIIGTCLDEKYDRPIFGAKSPEDAVNWINNQIQ